MSIVFTCNAPSLIPPPPSFTPPYAYIRIAHSHFTAVSIIRVSVNCFVVVLRPYTYGSIARVPNYRIVGKENGRSSLRSAYENS